MVVAHLLYRGFDWTVYFGLANCVILAALSVKLDPGLRAERRLQRQLGRMETRAAAQAGTLGRDTTGTRYIKLDAFNVLWIFVVCSLIGIIIETLYCTLRYGSSVNRAGLLFGPFSPIYGIGALLMTIALNRFWKSNPLLIFAVSGTVGGLFEALAAWLLERAFDVVAWDYSAMPGSLLGGRTNLLYMCGWGLLGLLWIRLLLPHLLQSVNHIPWKWRYSITALGYVLMIANVVMTMQALHCWQERAAGQLPDTPIARFYAQNFDDAWMQQRFETMDFIAQVK